MLLCIWLRERFVRLVLTLGQGACSLLSHIHIFEWRSKPRWPRKAQIQTHSKQHCLYHMSSKQKNRHPHQQRLLTTVVTSVSFCACTQSILWARFFTSLIDYIETMFLGNFRWYRVIAYIVPASPATYIANLFFELQQNENINKHYKCQKCKGIPGLRYIWKENRFRV